MKISIICGKGGVGKSTIAINLALLIAGLKSKPSVALVDTDAQQSCIKRLQAYPRENLTLITCLKNPHEVIPGLKHRAVIIDTPPTCIDTVYLSAAVSDVILIPVQPSVFDIEAAADTVENLRAVKKKYGLKFKSFFIVNRATPGTILSRTIREDLQQIFPDFPVLQSVLHDRENFKQSVMSGLSVLEYDHASLAAKEIGNMFIEVSTITKFKELKK